MNWTKESPTKPGWYWYCDDGSSIPDLKGKHLAEVRENNYVIGGLMEADIRGICYLIEEELAGYWQGPLEVPEVTDGH